ncbi:unnamed protein product [Ilex paraguariensis]|uniref:Leucine-rich repeat-containing N-terminal plant-type domain-containing protein n=1 Tax=Ilex paraguariensis TaxID=185542 RepID=A0ABC8SVK6_9AQUA
MDSRSSCIPIVALLLILLSPLDNSQSSNIICAEKERRALLNFRNGLIDSSGRLSSWSSAAQEDCCRWTGIRCDNITGRVIELSLSSTDLRGKINPSLLELEFLSHLDLSFNNFTDSDGGIPSFLGSMKSLTYLDLSGCKFHGMVPHQLGNLSRLTYLDLGYNDGVFVDNLSWISRLHSMEYLSMSAVEFGKEINWLQAMSTLPSLSILALPRCGLESMYPSLGNVNFTSLTVLELSHNHFKHEVPNWLGNLSSSLLYLDLRNNSLQGEIPITMSNLRSLSYLDLGLNQLTGQVTHWLGQLKSLQRLWLGGNSFYGPIPESLGNLSSLVNLYLYDNNLSGNLPKNLGLLSNLETLHIENNSLGGGISDMHFAKHSKLRDLDLSGNHFFFNVSNNWIPPFQLESIKVSSCEMGPKFPSWLRTQTSVNWLEMSNSGISDIVPDWFWNMASSMYIVDLSGNQIDGDLSTISLNSYIINLSSNRFKGSLPCLSANVGMLNVANNAFSGYISSFLCCEANKKNKLNLLFASNNLFSGELPSCWMYWQSLYHLNLGSNNLSGEIPNSIGSLYNLKSLHLQENNFFGYIPNSLRNCTSLALIDLGNNKFSGELPSWISETTSLLVLLLRSNKFDGNIPENLCHLFSIRILDLADNSLSGSIPKCFNNLSAMATTKIPDVDPFGGLNFASINFFHYENLSLVTKGRESEYSSILNLVKIMDLSKNNLSGSIPPEIFNLYGLRFLNISQNHLDGEIPENIGDMSSLESLDLSKNSLSGKIPETMSNLTSLNYLNLSYNYFSGSIPSSTQLQSLGETSFIGNAGLCGAPLPRNCTKKAESPSSTPVGEDGDESEVFWFYIGMGIGFALSFWGVGCVLFFKSTWRHAYFMFLDKLKDHIYVIVMLKVNWFNKKIKRRNDV